MATKSEQVQRNRYYAHLAMGKKQLGWEDDFYRNMFLVEHGATMDGDRISATTMSLGQLLTAHEAMKRLGYQPRKKAKKPQQDVNKWRERMMGKITAIWCTLADAGVIKNRSSIAMEKWCFKINNKPTQWCSAVELGKCIEGLKAIAWREHVRLKD